MVLAKKALLLQVVRKIPLGRVASAESIADEIAMPAPLVVTLLAQLNEDERDLVPWHRVVAKGGAIGRGLHRDQQFALLVREGVMVSPAGIVQDLGRHMMSGFADVSLSMGEAAETSKGNRSRGMKERP
jgi:methylated-DNA-protein-cysteine methyltransferase-like protein